MTEKQATLIDTLRQKRDRSMAQIAEITGLSVNTVKSWCRRHPLEDAKTGVCRQCGTPIRQLPHRKPKRFCSDRCRYAWWAANPQARKNRTSYTHICKYCGSAFETDRAAGSYCSVECFAKARKKAAHD